MHNRILQSRSLAGQDKREAQQKEDTKQTEGEEDVKSMQIETIWHGIVIVVAVVANSFQFVMQIAVARRFLQPSVYANVQK